jgi:hypothetical protein
MITKQLLLRFACFAVISEALNYDTVFTLVSNLNQILFSLSFLTAISRALDYSTVFGGAQTSFRMIAKKLFHQAIKPGTDLQHRIVGQVVQAQLQ